MSITPTREAIVAAARAMLGTPFHHQGRVPGVGVDCAGLVVCALQQSGLDVSDRAGYGRIPAQGLFSQTVAEQCDAIDLADVQPGDLLSFAFRSDPQHIAIVVSIDPIMMIHAVQTNKRVVENGLDATWRERLRGAWRVRGID